MILPKKIDDNLRDAMVSIHFNSSIPDVAVTGYFHKIMLEHKYETITTQPSVLNPFLGLPFQQLLSVTGAQAQQQIKVSGQPIYTNRKIKVSVTNSAINFNIIESYVGWDAYIAMIEAILVSMNGMEIVENYTKVSVRYISEYRNVSVFKNLKGNFTILDSNKKHQNTQIKTQLEDGNFRIFISIADNFVRPTSDNQNVEAFSLIDIDSQYLGPQTNNLEQLFQIIDQAHDKEKETFFNIVTDEFIKQSNPKY